MTIGILNRAGEAKDKMEETSELEQVQLAAMTLYIEGDGKISKNQLANELKTNESNITEIEGYWQYSGKNEKKYLISTDGNVRLKGNANTIKPTDYGKYVNYGVNYNATENSDNNGKWEILYADEDNVYLISQGNIGNKSLTARLAESPHVYTTTELNDTTKYPSAKKWLTGMIDATTNTWYSSDSLNYYNTLNATLYMLDSLDVWNSKYKNEYALYAIGGPTLEMICSSYDDIYNTNTKTMAIATLKDNGTMTWYRYPQCIDSRLKETVNGIRALWNEGTFSYWLASPEVGYYTYGVEGYISKDKDTVGCRYLNGWEVGYRPVVCLKCTAKLIWDNELNMYNIFDN